MDEQRGAGALAETEPEVEVRLEPEVVEHEGVARLSGAMRGEERVARRRREEPAAARRLLGAKREILAAWPRWSEVTAVEVVRRHAERVVDTHAIRAADALQIGAALVAAAEDPATLEFVTFDQPQAAAAEREGFHVRGAS